MNTLPALKERVRTMTLDAGFSRARILAPYTVPDHAPAHLKARYGSGSPSLLVAALPYGNEQAAAPDHAPAGERHEDRAAIEDIEKKYRAYIAPFARRNYYKEAVKRLQNLSRSFRQVCGGAYGTRRSEYRVFCNSPIPEKPLAHACGLGGTGRNSLIITPEAGSLVIIAAMTLPFPLESDPPEPFTCGTCGLCAEACPTHAIRRDGGIDRTLCIQWYASGYGDSVPRSVAEAWGQRLYGCAACQDACPHNKKPIRGAATVEGILPAYTDARIMLAMTDGEIRLFFKGTALGLSWLTPEHIRRNALLALNQWDQR
ncbi:MAG: 4Fe-4S binding protein [Treponema sp.]|jgi:epoxyqueuosine reductase|nr:4Fe-4S binding protein [Treponema sp.]